MIEETLVRDFTEKIIEELRKYFRHLNSNGIGRVEEKIEECLKEFASKIRSKP